MESRITHFCLIYDFLDLDFDSNYISRVLKLEVDHILDFNSFHTPLNWTLTYFYFDRLGFCLKYALLISCCLLICRLIIFSHIWSSVICLCNWKMINSFISLALSMGKSSLFLSFSLRIKDETMKLRAVWCIQAFHLRVWNWTMPSICFDSLIQCSTKNRCACI